MHGRRPAGGFAAVNPWHCAPIAEMSEEEGFLEADPHAMQRRRLAKRLVTCFVLACLGSRPRPAEQGRSLPQSERTHSRRGSCHALPVVKSPAVSSLSDLTKPEQVTCLTGCYPLVQAIVSPRGVPACPTTGQARDPSHLRTPLRRTNVGSGSIQRRACCSSFFWAAH